MAKISDRGALRLPVVGDVRNGDGAREDIRADEARSEERDLQRRFILSLMRERVVGGFCLHLSLLARFDSPAGIFPLVDGDFGRFRGALAAMAERKMTP